MLRSFCCYNFIKSSDHRWAILVPSFVLITFLLKVINLVIHCLLKLRNVICGRQDSCLFFQCEELRVINLFLVICDQFLNGFSVIVYLFNELLLALIRINKLLIKISNGTQMVFLISTLTHPFSKTLNQVLHLILNLNFGRLQANSLWKFL